MKRRLTLKSEHLTELTDEQMAALAGGYAIPTDRCFTGIYPSINAPCPTIEAQCPTVQPCIYIERTPLCPTEL